MDTVQTFIGRSSRRVGKDLNRMRMDLRINYKRAAEYNEIPERQIYRMEAALSLKLEEIMGIYLGYVLAARSEEELRQMANPALRVFRILTEGSPLQQHEQEFHEAMIRWLLRLRLSIKCKHSMNHFNL